MPQDGDDPSIPRCEECNEPLHRFDDGVYSGWSCDSCGWSWDDAPPKKQNGRHFKMYPKPGGGCSIYIPAKDLALWRRCAKRASKHGMSMSELVLTLLRAYDHSEGQTRRKNRASEKAARTH
jgi:hypothetical protein